MRRWLGQWTRRGEDELGVTSQKANSRDDEGLHRWPWGQVGILPWVGSQELSAFGCGK